MRRGHQRMSGGFTTGSVRLTARDASCEPVLVERALYVLGVRTAKELGKKWERDGTWSEYYRAAIGQVDGLL